MAKIVLDLAGNAQNERHKYWPQKLSHVVPFIDEDVHIF